VSSGRTGLSAGATTQALNGCKLVLPEGNSTPVYILMKKHNFARFDDSLPSLWRQVTLRRTEFRQTSHTEHHDHERDRKVGSSSVSHQSYPTATMIETSAPPVRDQWRVAPALTAVGTLSPRTSWYWPPTSGGTVLAFVSVAFAASTCEPSLLSNEYADEWTRRCCYVLSTDNCFGRA